MPILDVEGERIDAIVQPVEPRVVGGERRQRGVDLDQGDLEPGNARRQREAGGADAGAEVDRMFAGAARGSGGKQDRIVADAMAGERLAQPQAAAENRVFAGFENISPHRDAAPCRARRLP